MARTVGGRRISEMGEGQASKAALRRHFRIARNGLSQDQRIAAGESVAAQLLQLVTDSPIKTAAVTLSLPGELPTGPLMAALESSGVQLLIIPSAAATHPEDFQFETLKGEKEPTAEMMEVDLFVVPGLAFTVDGTRLGQGGGFFDRLLSRRRPDSLAVGTAYLIQKSDWLPLEPHDVPMDRVIFG
jgi:5-formyltetrahydrofolate cyclo-ligase